MSRKAMAVASVSVLLTVGVVLSLSHCQGCAGDKPKMTSASPSATPPTLASPAPSPTPKPTASPSPTPKPQGRLLKLTHDKLKLDYALYLPKDYRPERQWPLVVAFDSQPTSPLWEDERGLRDQVQLLADRHGWLVLMPKLSEGGADAAGLRRWVSEATALVDAVIARWSVDERRMAVCAWCGSPWVATALAVDRPGRFAGLLIVSGFEWKADGLDAAKVGKCKSLRVHVNEFWSDAAKWFRDAGVRNVTAEGEENFEHLPNVVPAK